MGPGCAWFVQNSAAQLDLDHHGVRGHPVQDLKRSPAPESG